VLIALPAFSIKGIGADLQAREINVELIQTADGQDSILAVAGRFLRPAAVLPDLEKLMKKEDRGTRA
jgi:hypothetical protein